jgi:molybdopterin-dependent oxidoreductase alpha subunit
MSLGETIFHAMRRWTPFGVLAPNKPRHARALLETIGQTQGKWHKAWKVLNGPCNGCAVQTDGLRDNVLPNSPHFCLVRLGLLEEVLRPIAPRDAFADAEEVCRLGNDRIERLGRVGQPLLWRRGEAGYSPISWEDAYSLAADWIRKHQGDRSGFFATSKGVCNEEYFAFQQFARVVGQTNNVDSCARQCHAASVTALKSTIGVGASTGSLSDFLETDCLVLAGTNLANNQPLVVRYIDHGRRTRSGKPYVIVVNAYREPGLERYWVPSNPRSALFGSKLCDEFVQVRTGGDIAFFNAVLKILIEEKLLTDEHREFIERHTVGFNDLAGVLADQSLEHLSKVSGVSTEQMRRVAIVLARSKNAMFVWGMGLTQHRCGTDNVKAVVNLALVLGQLGKAKAGVAPLRGQSSVQATGECGVAPDVFPGGIPVTPESAVEYGQLWGATLSDRPGLPTGRMIEAADRGEIELLMSLGGNLRDTMPDRRHIERVLSKVPYRIRLDVMMNREAMIEPGEASLVLPIRNWYEWDSVYTTTSTDRTIRAFRGTLAGDNADLPESWVGLREIARRVLGDDLPGFSYRDTQQIREAMERSIAAYEGIARLREPHQQMQWGGPFLLEDGFTNMPDNRAQITVLEVNTPEVPDGWLMLSTRRGFGQWNSQHRPEVRKDSFTGTTTRRAVLVHPDDLAALGLKHRQPVWVESKVGRTRGVCWSDENVLPGFVQTFWPIANDLLKFGVYDEPSCEPDYNIPIRLTRDTDSSQ